MPKCQAEDQGGWPICQNPAVYQTITTDPRYYYCEEHRMNRHVWRPDEELEVIHPTEPIPPSEEAEA